MSNALPTAGSIINLALKMAGVLGIGQTASAEDANDALAVLNMMLAQWQRKRWMVYSLDDVSFPSTGAASYTVGTGGSVNIARPDRIEAAFVRLTNGPQAVDYPLALLESREDYNRIALKSLATFPQVAFYDAAYPLANLYIWPAPPATNYQIHISVKTTLSTFSGLTTTMNLPPEYQEALLYNLTGRLRPMYGLQPDPTITAMAVASMNVIRNANAQVPRLAITPTLTRDSLYNIYGDQSY